MRILHVITSLQTGGAEKLMVDLLPRICERGHQVELCVFDGARTPFFDQLEDTGIRIHWFQKGGSIYNPLNIYRLWKLMNKDWDIVHTHNTAPQLFAALGGVLCSVVLVTTEHTTSNRRRDWKWYRPIDEWMYRKYSSVISISLATTQELQKYVSIKCPIYTIPNGIDVEKYNNAAPVKRSDIGCNKNSFLLMMVAGFRYQKDQDSIIRSIKSLPDNIQLCLVGDGERRKVCEELAESLGVSDKVIFTGLRTDVSNVLKTADVVVMSSHYEGFGLAAVEGMAAGKPVIASDVEGLADIVRNFGLLFPQGDANALASIVAQLYNNKDFYDKVVCDCKKRANDFDISNMVDGYIRVYKSLCPKK